MFAQKWSMDRNSKILIHKECLWQRLKRLLQIALTVQRSPAYSDIKRRKAANPHTNQENAEREKSLIEHSTNCICMFIHNIKDSLKNPKNVHAWWLDTWLLWSVNKCKTIKRQLKMINFQLFIIDINWRVNMMVLLPEHEQVPQLNTPLALYHVKGKQRGFFLRRNNLWFVPF